MAKFGIVKQMAGLVEESFTAVRLIASFANEKKEEEKFRKFAEQTMVIAKKASLWSAMMVGAFKTFIFGYFCYAFYIATIFIEKKFGNPSKDYKTYNTGDLLSVLISFNMGMMMLFGLTPNIQALVKAKSIGHAIFDVIDRVPEIKDHDECVDRFEIQKSIDFKDVSFRYPT